MRLPRIIQTLHRWWRGDRIRVSPTDGAILRLASKSVIAIRGEIFEVIGKRVVALAAGSAIVYDCVSVGSSCQVRVAVGSPRGLTLIDANGEGPLAEDDLATFPARG